MERFLVILVVSFFWPVLAAASSLTYHGRLLKSDGTPVDAAGVQLRIRIYSPGSEKCLFFDETYTRDLSSSQGAFAIRIGFDTPSSANTEPFALDRIFQNRSAFTFLGGKCANGSTYSPAGDDGRRIQLSFNDGIGWEDAPEQSIAQIPQAIESFSVGGYESSKLFRVHDGTGTPVTLTPWTQADYAKLEGLVAGTDSTYLKAETDPSVPAWIKDGIDWGEVSGKPATFAATTHTHPVSEVTSAGGAYFTYQPNNIACASGQVLKWTASNRWECGNDNSTAGGGTVTSVTATSGSAIVMGGTATDPEVGIQDASTSAKGVVQLATSSDTTAGLAVQANDSRLADGRIPVGSAGGDLGGSYPDPDVAKIRGIGVSTTPPQLAQVLVFDGTNWTPMNFGIDDLRTSGGASQFSSANCSAHQTLTWSAVTDAFTCMGISGLNASAVSAGTFDVARLPTGSSGASVAIGNDARFPSATCGSGSKMRWDGSMWQCETDAAGPWTIAGMDIHYDGGRVGVGTASPLTTLDVNGVASVTSSVEGIASYADSGVTYTIPDISTNIRRITLTENATLTLPSFTAPAGKVFTLTVFVKQDAVGSRTLNWAGNGVDSILWDQSTSAPAPAVAASKVTIYQFTKPADEAVWYGSIVWKQN